MLNRIQNDNKNQNEIESNTIEKKICIRFKTTTGTYTNILINPEHSVGTLIKKYLIKIDKDEIISLLDKGDKSLFFIYDGQDLILMTVEKLRMLF